MFASLWAIHKHILLLKKKDAFLLFVWKGGLFCRSPRDENVKDRLNQIQIFEGEVELAADPGVCGGIMDLLRGQFFLGPVGALG